MSREVQPLLTVLEATREELRRLTELARQKRRAVEEDDLLALNEVMNQEQATALALRGLDHRRERLLQDLGWQDVPLSGLAACCPPEWKEQVRAAADALTAEFRVCRQEGRSARETVERSLREVEHTLAELGVPPQAQGPGYAGGERGGQKAVTDFRA